MRAGSGEVSDDRRTAAINARVERGDRFLAIEWAAYVRRNLATSTPEETEQTVTEFIIAAMHRARQSERRRTRKAGAR